MSDRKHLQKKKLRSENIKTPDYNGPITDQMWREACEDGSKAKQMLVTMSIVGKGSVSHVDLENGNRIPVRDITEKQAKDFIAMLAPERVWNGFKQ